LVVIAEQSFRGAVEHGEESSACLTYDIVIAQLPAFLKLLDDHAKIVRRHVIIVVT